MSGSVARIGLALVVVLAAAGGGCKPGEADSVVRHTDSAGSPDRTEPSSKKTRPLVFIDPGHGAEDGGAVGPSGALEKDLVLSVARQLRDSLESGGLVDVALARDSDQELDLVRRPRMANAADADLFVSLHMNWAENPAATGIETYYLDTATDDAAERLAWRENLNTEDMPTDLENILSDLRLTGNVSASRALASRVHQELVDDLEEFYGDGEVRDRGLRTALFAVLVRAEMPAVLVELCFLSNRDEERRARTRAFQEEAAAAIAAGVIGFLRDQGELPPPDPLAGEGEGSP
jgi:N-acetylmuramoyl-L-alanine amidase